MLLLPGQTGIQRERREPEDGPESGRGRPSPRSKGHGGYPSGRGRQRLGSSSTKRSARLQVTQGRAKLGLRDAYCTAPTGNVICLGIFRSQRCPLHTRRGCTMRSQNTAPLSRISRIRAECRRRCKASIPEPKRNRAGDPEASIPRKSRSLVVPTAHRSHRSAAVRASRLLPPPPCSPASRPSWTGVVLPPVTATTPRRRPYGCALFGRAPLPSRALSCSQQPRAISPPRRAATDRLNGAHCAPRIALCRAGRTTAASPIRRRLRRC